MTGLRFEALYYGDRLRVVNPLGDIGIVTLWTPLRTAERLLGELAPGILDAATSRVAVLSNLYGDGMYAMLCNLLWNPQVRHVVAIGEDLGQPVPEELAAFVARGCQDAQLLGRPLRRIIGTGRLLPADPAFDEAALRSRLTFTHLGRFAQPDVGDQLRDQLVSLSVDAPVTEADRVRVQLDLDLPDDYAYLPSDAGAHSVVRRRPLDCWEELVVRVMRFGRPVTIGGEPRLELLNVKAVITEPTEDGEATLAEYGFRLADFRRYQERMLDPELPADVAYTYGNRLRGHFPPSGGPDTLARVIEVLRDDSTSRRGYVALWDTAEDLGVAGSSLPCLTTLFFRDSADGLTLTATYRAHNLLVAWLQNIYGLLAVQRHVAEAVGLPVGPLTVLSHSLGVDPRSPEFAKARVIVDGWSSDDDCDRDAGGHLLRSDPNGYFVVSIDADAGQIVAEHRYGGVLVKSYRADRAAKIERAVAADMAVSLVSHAMWLGRELTLAELQLRGRTTR